MEMWESRVLGEISKSLWEPLFGFHRDVISIAVFVVAPVRETEIRGCCPLTDVPIAVPGASYAVVDDGSRCQNYSRADHRRRFGINGPGARRRPGGGGTGAGSVGRERSVR